MKTGMLTQELAKEILDYDSDTGHLCWKPRASEMFATRRAFSIWNVRYAGKVAGHKDVHGYIVVGINSILHKAHRIIYLMVHGISPEEIDHIDGNGCNNKISNLRSANRMQNMANYSRPKTNTSGYKGVSWNKKNRKWVAYSRHENKQKYLGSFNCRIEAAKKYNEAAIKYHGEFAKLNEFHDI